MLCRWNLSSTYCWIEEGSSMDKVTGAVANDVATGAVGSLISKLWELLTEEYKLQKSAPEKLVSLIKNLECAHAALRKVGEVPPDQLDENVRIWAREIRDSSYDMENEIDTFLLEGAGGHEGQHSAGQESMLKRIQDYVGGLFGKMNNMFKRRKLTAAFDDINKRLEEVTQRHGRYTVDSITVARPAATSNVDPRLAAMYKEVTQLVGISKSSSDVINMLEKMKMVSVVGGGGLGKTTLAKSAYDKLRVDFECSAFVPVGRDPALKKVFRDILIEIDKKKYMDPKMIMLDERQLINELRENLENKRYLLVFDDIWDTKSWEIIKLAFIEKNSGSRVITTTRILEVAKEVGNIYELQKLPYEESKKLFYTRIFGADNVTSPNNQLDEVSDRILKKCDGVPLAIITMASLLVHKPREQWIEVCNSIFNRQVNRDVSNNKDVSNTEWILSLSYYDLPAHLKTCLLYLSAFPEDYFIQKDTLILMWLAEGFVQNRDGTGFYEVGEGYFNDLINRSIIQVPDWSEQRYVEGCRVHDVVLDLLRRISQRENFVTFSNNDNTILPSGSVYRLAHQNRTLEPTHHDHYLRSLIAYNCEFRDLSLARFRLLRVLALVGCKGREGSIHLGDLVSLLHLRYLRLNLDTIELPEGIEALKLLQTLDIYRIVCLPPSIGHLTHLICLRARWKVEVPSGVIEKLTSLEQLTISVSNDTVGQFVKELGKLQELRVLHAELDKAEAMMPSDLMESLGNLRKIQKLRLSVAGSVKQIDEALCGTSVFPQTLRFLYLLGIVFCALPSCINPSGLPNLSILLLDVNDMNDEDLEILGLLPQLRELTLLIRSKNNLKIHSTNDGWFRKLRYLWLGYSRVQFVPKEDLSVPFLIGCGQPDVVLVTETRDFMPKLEVLRFAVTVHTFVHDDDSFGNLGLECIPSLQNIRVGFYCESAFPDEAEKVEAALRKAIADHPSRPSLELRMYSTDRMMVRPAYDDLATEVRFKPLNLSRTRRTRRKRRMSMKI